MGSLYFVAFVPPGAGYITTATLKQILHEIDDTLTEVDLNGIIEEIDEDGSGTVDFDGNTAMQSLSQCRYLIDAAF